MIDLVRRADLSVSTIKRFENDLPQRLTRESLMMLHEALVDAGVYFLDGE